MRDPRIQHVRSLSMLLMALVLLTTLPGCSPPAPDEVQVIDLLGILKPDRTIRFEDSPTERKVWDFSEGLPEGWTAGPEGVEVVQRSDGILLKSPDGSPTWVETRIIIDPLRHQKLQAVTDPPGAQPLLLYYSFDDPPYFYPQNRIEGKAKSSGAEQGMGFTLPGPDAQERPVKALRLYTGRRTRAAVIKQLILIPQRKNLLSKRLRHRARVGLGQEYRRCWRIAGEGTREVTIQLPPGDANLTFALGTLRGRSPAKLTVEVCRGEAAGKTIVRQAFPPPSAGWQDLQADLSPWCGKEVTIRFSVKGEGTQPVRLIGTPQVKTVPGTHRPSVLLIVLDAQRADQFSLYGHQQLTSPHLARLAEEGILFSAAAAPCSWTIPSVVSTFTGRFADPEQLAKGHGQGMSGDTTLAQRFSSAGFATGGFSANCLLTASKGFTRGFDAWYVAPHMDTFPTAGGMNQRVLRWLRAHRGEETFCYVHYMDPHAPYDAPWPETVYDLEHEEGGLTHGQGWKEGFLWPLVTSGEQLDHEGVQHVRNLYQRGSEYADFRIGCLLAALRREGLQEDTAILVTADHGEELHDHNFWSHGFTLYQEVLDVPMILRLPEPGPRAGTVVHTPVSLVDVAPTLTAIAGLPGDSGWSDGLNMLRLPEARTLYSSTTGHGPLRFAITHHPWKYIYFNRKAFAETPPETAQGRWLESHGQPEELLFNLEDDPGERHDLIGQRPEIEAEMRGMMADWFANAGSDLPASVPGEAEPISEEELGRLRALGYVQ